MRQDQHLAKALQLIASLYKGLRVFEMDGRWLVPVDHYTVIEPALEALVRTNPTITELHVLG